MKILDKDASTFRMCAMQSSTNHSQYSHDIDDLLSALGYATRGKLIEVLRRDFQELVDYIKERDLPTRGRPRVRFIVTAECAKILTCRCASRRALRPEKSVNIAGVELTHIRRYHPKEEETINFIGEVYRGKFSCQMQSQIGPYRVDLLLENRIAVECDENGHKAYDPVSEASRQSYIEGRGYHVYRFNPDSPSFSLAKVVSDLNAMLYD